MPNKQVERLLQENDELRGRVQDLEDKCSELEEELRKLKEPQLTFDLDLMK